VTEWQPTRFERAMFASLWPALFLPIAAATIALWVQPGADEVSESYGWVGYLILGTFLIVLLCSMNLHAWLLTRRPVNLQNRAVPLWPGVALAVLYATVLAMTVSLFIMPLGSGVVGALAPATAIESIIVLVLVIATRKPSPRNWEMPEPSRRVLWGVRVYLIVAIVGLVHTIVLATRPMADDTYAYWIPVAVALGLPWSPAVVQLVSALIATAAILGLPWADVTVPIFSVLMLAPLAVNAALAAAVLASPRSRHVALRVLFLR
jgi:hypothetical protein